MTLEALLAVGRSRGLRIPARELETWLRELVARGWLEEASPDDWVLTARGRRHFWPLREAHLEEYRPTAPVGAFRRRERRVEEDG